MRKFAVWWRFSAATVATVATKLKKLVATLFPQGSNTGSNSHGTLHSRLSRLKMPIFGRVGSNGSNTFPNFVQELLDLRESSAISPSNYVTDYDLREDENVMAYEADEFDHEDFDEWWEDAEYEEPGEPGQMSTERWNPEGYQEWLRDHKSWE